MASGLGIPDEEALNIYTDGSSFPNKKRAAGVGMRFVWINEQGNEEIEDYAPTGWESATIDEMELMACKLALKEARRLFSDMSAFKKIIIFSDSSYVVDNFTNAMHVWPVKKWLKTNGMPVANIDIWKAFKKEVNLCPNRVEMQWVKGHKKNVHNKAADKLARKSANAPFNKTLSRSETTKKWSSRSTRRGCIQVYGQDACIRIISRKYIREAKVTEYRYEIIDHKDKHFNDVDFIFCKELLSRSKCYKVRFNKDQNKPFILEIIDELNPDDYKH